MVWIDKGSLFVEVVGNCIGTSLSLVDIDIAVLKHKADIGKSDKIAETVEIAVIVNSLLLVVALFHLTVE